ncbi:Retrovirus-related Pol polyprotein from transposon TNT 1-94 [Candida viswanathii]|jgi:hypothetical protein|uniref:Retrovirus-related Pol polyprotein from transposon TNT 1-94 n=1 Tax=Candida viswanathii TaxID=5486 RepID=A0A367YN79_9ASCO|nr:Retrovirus-related Pol polyprotein from transposon TNT 1-94 [Candida viswanathii]
MFLNNSIEIENVICLFDSGASSTVVNKVEYLHDPEYEFDVEEYSYAVANGEKVTATAVGNVVVKLPNKELLTISDVAYIKSLPHNLISINDLTKSRKLSVLFYNGKIKIRNEYSKKILMEALLDEEKLYKCKLEFIIPKLTNGKHISDRHRTDRNTENRKLLASINSGNSYNSIFNLTEEASPLQKDLWSAHLDTGHMSIERLLWLIKNHNLNVTRLPNDEEKVKNCILCRIANARAAPHNHITTRSPLRVLELVHADTMGPINALSYAVSSDRRFIVMPVTYYLTSLIDGYSRYASLIITKNKLVAIPLIEEMVTWNNKSAEKIHMIRLDNASELPTAAQLRQLGIKKSAVPPYSASMNGHAERFNLSIQKIIMKTLISFGEYAGHATVLFTYVVDYALNVYNNTPSKHVFNEVDNGEEMGDSIKTSSYMGKEHPTPYQMFYKNPRYKFTFVQFGIDCIVKITKPAEFKSLNLPIGEKYSPSVVHGSVLGISNDSNSFIVLFQNPNFSIRTTPNVQLLPSRNNIYKFLKHVPSQDVALGTRLLDNWNDMVENSTIQTTNQTESSVLATDDDIDMNQLPEMLTSTSEPLTAALESSMDVDAPTNNNIHNQKTVKSIGEPSINSSDNLLRRLIEKYPDVAQERQQQLEKLRVPLVQLKNVHQNTNADVDSVLDATNPRVNITEPRDSNIPTPVPTCPEAGGDGIIQNEVMRENPTSDVNHGAPIIQHNHNIASSHCCENLPTIEIPPSENRVEAGNFDKNEAGLDTQKSTRVQEVSARQSGPVQCTSHGKQILDKSVKMVSPDVPNVSDGVDERKEVFQPKADENQIASFGNTNSGSVDSIIDRKEIDQALETEKAYDHIANVARRIEATEPASRSLLREKLGEVTREKGKSKAQSMVHENPYITRSGRIVKPTYKKIFAIVKNPDLTDPNWRAARQAEIDNFVDRKVFRWVDPPPAGTKLLGTAWIDTYKEGDLKNVVYKSRLVIRGDQQTPNLNYLPNEVSVPVADLVSIRVLTSLAADLCYQIHHLDISSAYLNGKLTEDNIFVRPPRGVRNGNKIWLLLHPIYGMKQAGYAWFREIESVLKDMKFVEIVNANGVFKKDYDNGEKLFVALYVDDLFVMGREAKTIERFKDELSVIYDLKYFGTISEYLGVSFTFGNQSFKLDQTNYLKNLLEEFDIPKQEKRLIPLAVKINEFEDFVISNVDGRFFDAEVDPRKLLDESGIKFYQKAVGHLQWAVTCTRPDLSFVTNKLSAKCHAPTISDYKRLMDCFRYINQYPDIALQYQRSTNHNSSNGVIISIFSDASFSQFIDEKPVSGFAIYINDNLVHWASKKQTVQLESTAESELIALDSATKAGLKIKRMLRELGFNVTDTICYEDNSAVVAKVNNQVSYTSGKILNKAVQRLKELVRLGEIKVVQVASADNIADGLTKAFSKSQFMSFKERLLNFHDVDIQPVGDNKVTKINTCQDIEFRRN